MDLIDREQLKSTIRKMVEIPNETRAQVIGAISRAKAVPLTNADRIRSMTDEELAASLAKTIIEVTLHAHNMVEALNDVPTELLENIAEEYLKWLQQPAEG